MFTKVTPDLKLGIDITQFYNHWATFGNRTMSWEMFLVHWDPNFMVLEQF